MTWPATFGDTTAEYVAAHDGAGFVGDASALVWVVGADAISFLQGIITQDVEGMEVGTVARSLLLEPRGKLSAVMWLLRDEDRVGLVLDAHLVDETIASLARWRIRVDVEFEIDERPVFEVWGPSPDFATADGWSEEDGVIESVLAYEPIQHSLIVGLDPSALERRGLTPIGTVVATTVRIESGEPRMGVDIDEKTIPQESGLVSRTVSFDKGCYLGQELVARIDTRGRVNRHLRAIRLHESVIPPVGAVIAFEDSIVGTLSSVGESLAVRAPVGLGLVRREAEPGSEVTVTWDGGSSAATVEALPLLTG